MGNKKDVWRAVNELLVSTLRSWRRREWKSWCARQISCARLLKMSYSIVIKYSLSHRTLLRSVSATCLGQKSGKFRHLKISSNNDCSPPKLDWTANLRCAPEHCLDSLFQWKSPAKHHSRQCCTWLSIIMNQPHWVPHFLSPSKFRLDVDLLILNVSSAMSISPHRVSTAERIFTWSPWANPFPSLNTTEVTAG